MIRFIIILLINICVTFLMLYYFVLSKSVILEEGISISQDITRSESKILLSKNSHLTGDISLEKGEIILQKNAKISGNIFLASGKIILEQGAQIHGNIQTKGEIILEENAKVFGDISKYSDLKKHSNSKISGEKPNLFITTNYPEFLKYFDVLPQKHKEAFGYIFVTTHNMDIRGEEKKPEEYFQNIFVYKDNSLQELEVSNDDEQIKNLFAQANKYINIIPERNVGRFGVGFVTKNYANDKNFADMYLSADSLSSILFMHETGHVLDYKYAYIDYHTPDYPYPDRESAITEYGEFHKGEDFSEAYRYYVLHRNSFLKKIEENPIRQQKYDYLKQYVFDGKEYN